MIKFRITITYSKIVALIVLCAAVFLDVKNETVQAFMFSLPFITFLITGKMLSDYKTKTLKPNG